MSSVKVVLPGGTSEAVQKRIGREIADVVAEHTKGTVGNVIVDVVVDGWPSSATSRAEHCLWARVRTPVPDEYARIWRSHYVPGLERIDGFLEAQLLRIHEPANELIRITKWLSKAHADAYLASEAHVSLNEPWMELREIPEHGTADYLHLEQ